MDEVLFLRSQDCLCPDFLLGDSPVCLGRGPMTGIKDSRVSREHLTISLQEPSAEGRVLVRQAGPNPAVIGGKPLLAGDSAYLTVGESVSTSYAYCYLSTKKYFFFRKLLVSSEGKSISFQVDDED